MKKILQDFFFQKSQIHFFFRNPIFPKWGLSKHFTHRKPPPKQCFAHENVPNSPKIGKQVEEKKFPVSIFGQTMKTQVWDRPLFARKMESPGRMRAHLIRPIKTKMMQAQAVWDQTKQTNETNKKMMPGQMRAHTAKHKHKAVSSGHIYESSYGPTKQREVQVQAERSLIWPYNQAG